MEAALIVGPAILCLVVLDVYSRRGIKTEEKAKVDAAVWGTKFIQFLTALVIFNQDDLNKRLNRLTGTWRNGCFEKWMIIRFTPYQTTTLPKWMF